MIHMFLLSSCGKEFAAPISDVTRACHAHSTCCYCFFACTCVFQGNLRPSLCCSLLEVRVVCLASPTGAAFLVNRPENCCTFSSEFTYSRVLPLQSGHVLNRSWDSTRGRVQQHLCYLHRTAPCLVVTFRLHLLRLLHLHHFLHLFSWALYSFGSCFLRDDGLERGSARRGY